MIWQDMTELYQAKWSSRMGNVPHLAWERALTAVDARDVERALAALTSERVEWPPTDLMGFMVLIDDAMRERFDLPTEAEALSMGRACDWRCAAVYEAAQRVGLWRVTGGPMVAKDDSPRFLRDWARHWGKVCREVVAGCVFNGPREPRADPYAVALPSSVDCSKDALWRRREQHGVDDLRKRLGLKPRVREQGHE